MSRLIDCTEWPLNIFKVIFDNDNLSEDSLPKDYAGTLAYVLTGMLTDKEQRTLRAYYQRGLTFHSIGKQFGLSGTRMRQIHDKALNKLRQPSRLALLRYGVVDLMERYRAWCREGFYNMGYQDGFKRGSGETSGPLYKNPYMQKNELSVAPIEESPIDVLELSPRVYNSLRRSHICTVGEVISLSNTELRNVKNLGELSLRELERKLACFDLKLREE